MDYLWQFLASSLGFLPDFDSREYSLLFSFDDLLQEYDVANKVSVSKNYVILRMFFVIKKWYVSAFSGDNDILSFVETMPVFLREKLGIKYLTFLSKAQDIINNKTQTKDMWTEFFQILSESNVSPYILEFVLLEHFYGLQVDNSNNAKEIELSFNDKFYDQLVIISEFYMLHKDIYKKNIVDRIKDLYNHFRNKIFFNLGNYEDFCLCYLIAFYYKDISGKKQNASGKSSLHKTTMGHILDLKDHTDEMMNFLFKKN